MGKYFLRDIILKNISVVIAQRYITNIFIPFYLFFDGNYKADADLMIGDMTDDGDDDKFHQHVINTQKGFGECALLGLQVFVT